jgi:8-oxo-dGTP diphosphatase
MIEIAQVLLFDRDDRLLIYLRDDKAGIPFPNRWDFFGGHLEPGETPEQALLREVKEELGIELMGWQFFRSYECLVGDVYPNTKYIYQARIDKTIDELTLHEGQRLASIKPDQCCDFKFANILATILEDFITAGAWPRAVDNSGGKLIEK